MTDEKDRPDLVKFAQRMLRDWPEYGLDMDGGELQEIAVECGLLYPVRMDAPCSDDVCNCADCGATFPTTCYRRATLT